MERAPAAAVAAAAAAGVAAAWAEGVFWAGGGPVAAGKYSNFSWLAAMLTN